MRIYYRNEEYEANKHKIARVWLDVAGNPLPEETPGLIITESYSVLEIDERYNKLVASLLLVNGQIDMSEGTDLPDRFYVDGDGKLRDEFDNLVTVYPNPQKESYKLSQLYGLTQQQLENYIDNNVTNLAEAKSFIKKLSAVVLWLVNNQN